MPSEDEAYVEKTMISGEVMTIAESPTIGWWDVDQWDMEGNNRWHRQYQDYALAKAEFDKWN